jgi:hypothetical protein
MVWCLGIAGLIPQSLQLQAQVTLASLGSCHKQGNVQSCVRIDQCVPVVRTVEVLVFLYLRNSCYHVTEVGGP